jgi:hypothetical protein
VLAQGENVAGTGFLDLIGLLLALPSQQPKEQTVEHPIEQSTAAPVTLLQTATPDQIAAALIKSMSKSTPARIVSLPTALAKKTAQKSEETNLAQVTAPPVLRDLASPNNLTVSTPPALPQVTLRSATEATNELTSPTSAAQMSGTAIVPGDTVTVIPNAPAPNTPVAFEMVLTPQSSPAQPAQSAMQPAPQMKPDPLPDPPATEPTRPTPLTAKPGLRAPIQPQEEPERVLAAAASAATADNASQGNLSQAPFHQSPPPEVVQSQPSPSADTPAPAPEIKAVDQTTQVKPGSAQQITVRVSTPQAPAVDLHVVQRAGHVEVAVRTPDPVLETALRQDLGTLVHSLERSGFHTETFVPVTAAGSASSSQMSSQGDRPDTHPDFSQNGSGQNSGNHNQGGQHRREDPSQNQRYSEWADALEENQ